MKQRSQKRPKTQDPLILNEDADFQSIEQWLMQVNSQDEVERYNSIAMVLLRYPHTVVDQLLPHFSNVELFKVVSRDNFIIIRSLSESIRFEVDDWINAARKLFMFSRRVFAEHRSIIEIQLYQYWMMLERSIKKTILESLEVAVLSSFFSRASEGLTTELIPYLEDKQWLGLLAHDDYALCRQLISTPDIALTLTKLRRLLNNRFTESHQAIILACLKNAIVQNCYPFFEGFTQQMKDYISIVISFNQFDLLITACNAKNQDFLTLLVKNLFDYERRKALVLVATWLSIELNALETENDHLRNSILADLSSLLQEHVLLTDYGAVKNSAEMIDAKARILKVRSTQLPEQRKRALLAMLAMQSESQITIEELHQHILKRSSPDQHRCPDDRELIVIRAINEYIGYCRGEVPISQLSQHNDYERFKSTCLARFDSMRLKTLEQEVPRLQADLARFWASDIEIYRRIVMPRPTRAEQKLDVSNNIITRVDKLSPNSPVVWLDSLDLETWTHPASPHHLIPGMNEHLTLAKALLSQRDSEGVRSMLFASVGFFVQVKGNMTPFIHVPVRFSDHSMVRTSPNFNLLTEKTDYIACEHPLKIFIDYLLHGQSAVSSILKQGFSKERRANITRVIAATFDAHTNTMPCKKCLEYAADIQRSGKLLKVIEAGLKSLSIQYLIGNMPMTLLFRFSLLSMTEPSKVNLLGAKPESTLTPPSSQLSPSAHVSKKNQRPGKENLSALLMENFKEPQLVKTVDHNPIQEPRHFVPRCNASSKENVRALCKNSVVFHELKVPNAVLAEKKPSSTKDYTGLIGSCGLSNGY